MEPNHKLFVKRLRSLSVKNGLKCKLIDDSTINGSLDVNFKL